MTDKINQLNNKKRELFKESIVFGLTAYNFTFSSALIFYELFMFYFGNDKTDYNPRLPAYSAASSTALLIGYGMFKFKQHKNKDVIETLKQEIEEFNNKSFDRLDV